MNTLLLYHDIEFLTAARSVSEPDTEQHYFQLRKSGKLDVQPRLENWDCETFNSDITGADKEKH